MSKRNILSLAVSIISLIVLIPGVMLSVLSIKTSGTVSAPAIKAQFPINFFDTSNSILQTTSSLFSNGYQFVACMILLFSIIVPVAKGGLFIYMLVTKNLEYRRKIYSFINVIAKWSMCDVFITAIFLTYLSSGAKSHVENHVLSIFGAPIQVKTMIGMSAQLQPGFYCFLAYCVLSLLAVQLYQRQEVPSSTRDDEDAVQGKLPLTE